ncbi:hypothetical protein DUNSADRAFT_10089 [Dunaliella salina]|uniref:Large ribosomal subunit protein bL25 beta domain-containing protein n=1 Tax=Dunaliella salina TaxID=3046 RepID=A0ABQ7GG26_DUNSA|nr:hypothetical protein DUNSADRAFT_10089 [Dunaliella salina]|eukprot:KAF5833557.1 hypothetical protein DUNSADRAFT_10089 [Dunaliella salina]
MLSNFSLLSILKPRRFEGALVSAAINHAGFAGGSMGEPVQGSTATPLRHASTQQEAQGVVPAHLLEELHDLEANLRKSSSMDGRKRLQFSLNELSWPLPRHEIEAGLHRIDVHLRAGDGSIFSKWLRRIGRTPLRVQSLPGNRSLLLHAATKDAERLVQLFGRNGCTARVIALHILHPQNGTQLGVIRAKPQKVHMTSTKAFVVQNVDFLYCPHNRIVNVDVPVRLVNDDKAPGVKQGGWMQMFRRTVRFQTNGHLIPPFVDVDVGELGLEQELLVNQVPVPPGCKLPANKVSLAPVLRCTTSMTDT